MAFFWVEQIDYPVVQQKIDVLDILKSYQRGHFGTEEVKSSSGDIFS